MSAHQQLATKAEAVLDRFGLEYTHLIGVRFAINTFIATAIVWFTLLQLGVSNPIWAIASMMAAADPEPKEARRMFRSRFINVMVGCAVGFGMLLFGSQSHWMLPFALALTVLISSYVIRIKTMWRQAPITAAIVIAAGLAQGAKAAGIESGMHKVAEVVFGCMVGLVVSWMMSKVWLVKPPAETTESAEPQLAESQQAAELKV